LNRRIALSLVSAVVVVGLLVPVAGAASFSPRSDGAYVCPNPSGSTYSLRFMKDGTVTELTFSDVPSNATLSRTLRPDNSLASFGRVGKVGEAFRFTTITPVAPPAVVDQQATLSANGATMDLRVSARTTGRSATLRCSFRLVAFS